LMPRLYGGEVTTRSTLASARRDIPVMQSCLRRSNLVIQGMSCDSAARTSRKLPKARSISGEHRLPACPFRQPAEKLFNHQQHELLQRFGVVGKLPTTTGWQPALPRDAYSRVFVNSIILSHG